jgi:hypothetical protein
MTWPVAGLIVSNVWPSSASTCSPLITILTSRTA